MENTGEDRAVVHCDICFEPIPAGQPVVRAAQQMSVSPRHPKAGRIDGRIIKCDESCWELLRLSGTHRRLDT